MIKLPWPRAKPPSSSLPLPLISHLTHHSTSPLTNMSSRSTPPQENNSYLVLTQYLYDAVKACRSPSSAQQARKIHARLISMGLVSSIFLQNNLLNAYFNCGLSNDARQLFQEISNPNVFSWNVLITGLSNAGRLDEARLLFDEMPERDSASWNSLMSGYFKNGKPKETIEAFVSMLRSPNGDPNVFTLTCTMKACGALQCCELGRQLHAVIKKLDFEKDPQIQGSLIDMYLKCGDIDLASRVFENLESPNLFCWNSMILGYSRLFGADHALEMFNKMPERDVVSWNTMISILSQDGRGKETLLMVVKMYDEGFTLDSTTYACALSACAHIPNLEWGRHLHGQLIRTQLNIDVFAGSALVDMYAKCSDLEAATRAFHSLPDRNAVSWTALIGGFAQSGGVTEAMKLFNQMRAVPVAVDQFTLATVITACCCTMDKFLGTQLQSHSIRIGYSSSVPVSNALVTMYAKCGEVQCAESVFQSMTTRDIISWTSMITAYSQLGNISKAHQFFDTMSSRNVVTWNAMLAAYIQHGHVEEGLKMYCTMLKEDVVRPDWVTFATVLSACADAGALRLGDQVITQTTKVGLDFDTSVANGIITMYSKCGKIREARNVFDTIPDKDLVSWNAMITAYAHNGQGRGAIEIFESMLREGIEPDYISCVAVLSGCSHSGLVDEGKFYFDSMTKIHSISPGLEHYACMVDLLGRAGFLEQAKEMIDSMIIKPSAEIWGTLLGACKIHGNRELAECAVKHLFELDTKDSGSYVLLAKIYSDAGKSDDCAVVRKLMRERGIRKNPGCSWIEVKNKVHVFSADDLNHPQIHDIQNMLNKLIRKIEAVGYVNEPSSRSESRHSEKLAVAFGIMSLPSWMSIHVMKNLRICGDCHTVIKLISLVTSREIIVRDANRFHHFSEGCCSCRDYW